MGFDRSMDSLRKTTDVRGTVVGKLQLSGLVPLVEGWLFPKVSEVPLQKISYGSIRHITLAPNHFNSWWER